MQYLFSEEHKFRTWRKLWIALAEGEKAAGLSITDEQLDELRANADNIDYDLAARYEKELRHDVMAHIRTYGDACPNARAIIHLGATSCYVGDNTDMLIMRDALKIIMSKLVRVMKNLRAFALANKDIPALAYTHLQPAQLTTVGKRASLWLYDLSIDYADAQFVLDSLAMLGSKGTTGTQASFVELFEGDTQKIDLVENYIAEKFGFKKTVPVSGQTYTRKFDYRVLSLLSQIAQSAYKFSGDMRILSAFKEADEPFEKHQVGSSAMPYKRNPMRSERIAALARYVLSAAMNPAVTASTQWFERTLDDSANRRISVAEAFLATDAILNIYINVSDGIIIYPKMIRSRVMNELPFMATENIMMEAVKRGGDRQTLHEIIREHSIAAGRRVKEEGLPNDLITRIAADERFGMSEGELRAHLSPEAYTGRAPEQTESFIREYIDPIVNSINLSDKAVEIKV
jgi:adenylosuccinate lyase